MLQRTQIVFTYSEQVLIEFMITERVIFINHILFLYYALLISIECLLIPDDDSSFCLLSMLNEAL